MQINRKIIIILPILLVVITCSTILSSSLIKNNSLKNNNLTKRTLTLKQAYNLSYNQAIKWNPKASLYFMTSVDTPNESNINDGLDGRRRFWNFEYVIPNTKRHLLLTVHDGNIINTTYINSATVKERIINPREIVLSSEEAVKKVQKQYNLKPGQGWAEGYHFVLNKNNNKTILTVVGLDPNGNFAKVNFDATNKSVISAFHKIVENGGIYKGNKPISIYSDIDKKVALLGGASPNTVTSKTIFVWGSENPLTSKASFIIKKTEDGGESWNNIQLKDEIFQLKFSPNYQKDGTIFATTSNGLIVSYNKGLQWKDVLKTETPILDFSINTNKIAILRENRISISKIKGSDWITIDVPQNMKGVELDSEGNLFTYSDKGLYKLNRNEWLNIETRLKGDILGFSSLNNIWTIYSDNELYYFDLHNKKWTQININNNIRKIFLNFQANRYQFLVDCKNADLLKIEKKGGLDEWIKVNIKKPHDGELTILTTGLDNEMIYYLSPQIIWEKM